MNSEQMEARICKREPSVANAALGRPTEQVVQSLQVVSLGNSCGTKLSIRRLGLDEATLPCDWIRSSMKGLLQWLKNDFEDFLAVEKRYDLTMQDCAMTVYRSQTHSFWHDDINDSATQEKLRRRVSRFLGLAADNATSRRDKPRALLFVRSVATSAELSDVEVLFQLLKQRFEIQGRRVFLLVIVDGQPLLGPVLHTQHEGLMFWLQPLFSGRLALDCSVPAPYEDAIAFFVQRILNGPSSAENEAKCPQVGKASEIRLENGGTDSGLWVGKVALEGLPEDILFAAFEGLDTVSSDDRRRFLIPEGLA